MASFSGRTVVVFGGSSGIGEATSLAFGAADAEVWVVGRDLARTRSVAERVGGLHHLADAHDRSALNALFERVGQVDDLVITASGGDGAGRFAELDLDAVRRGFEDKVMAQLAVLQAARTYFGPSGSATLVTAASARAAMPGTAGLAVINGALECAVPALAAEFAPIRVNAVSPGVIATPWWDRFGDTKQAIFDRTASQLPLKKVGSPTEVAELIVAVAATTFMTGTIIGIDGGAALALGAAIA